MNLRKITDNVRYVGVNDRSSLLFEGLWPLPYGVSYNSYLVKGTEKTALIDGVEAGHARELIASLKSEEGVGKIDYLVINHMEPDHSGSIPQLIALFPEMKIVGNSKTIQMVQGFYHIDNPDIFLEVKDNSELALGDLTLSFIMTPMVHWPETMMTYCKEERVIFTGDAFGTFGALNGGVTDDDMDCGIYIDEMYRYYSNIVGKYGKFVQNAMTKIAPLDFEYVCSTHGPVWHARLEEVKGIVSRLATQEPEAGVTIVYGSMYGNTGDLADLFASELNRRGIKNIKVHNATIENLSYIISDAFRYEGLIIGAPTYSNEIFPPVRNFLEAMRIREVRNKIVASFGNHGWAPLAAKAIAASLASMELEDAGTVAMKQSMNAATEAEVSEIADRFVEMLTKK